jgi:hypothetical protein
MARTLITVAAICLGTIVQTAGSTGAAARTQSTSPAPSVNAVIEWNRTLLAIVRAPRAQPATIHSTRNFAILHAAVFDAIANASGGFDPYLVHLSNVPGQVSPVAAADQAAHDVLVSLYPSFTATLDAELAQDFAQIPLGAEKDEGITVGRTVAAAVLAARDNDGSAIVPPPFVPGNQPGEYQLTPPNFAPADFRQWPQVTPFVLKQADEFRPAPPPVLASHEYSEAFNEVKSLGFISSAVRTPEQTEIGRFWNGNIQDFWNEIAQTAAIGHNLDLPRTAHLFAVLNFSLADTAIAFFEAKYFYNFWRPVTAIRAAGTDGNPDTVANPDWLPLSTNTAPDPSYPGAHSAISAAGAEVLELELGERFTFDVTSESLPGITRHFTSFAEAAREAGLSRIYAGQHYRFDHVAGKDLGRKVARQVFDSILLPREAQDR